MLMADVAEVLTRRFCKVVNDMLFGFLMFQQQMKVCNFHKEKRKFVLTSLHKIIFQQSS